MSHSRAAACTGCQLLSTILRYASDGSCNPTAWPCDGQPLANPLEFGHASDGSCSPTAGPTTLNQASRYRSGRGSRRFPPTVSPTLSPTAPPSQHAVGAGFELCWCSDSSAAAALESLAAPCSPRKLEISGAPCCSRGGSSSAMSSAVRQGCSPKKGEPSSGCACASHNREQSLMQKRRCGDTGQVVQAQWHGCNMLCGSPRSAHRDGRSAVTAAQQPAHSESCSRRYCLNQLALHDRSESGLKVHKGRFQSSTE